jgi:regulator of Ty1 transposition protein 103
LTSSAAVSAANTEYDKMHDPSAQVPTPPVHAARLSQLLKSLANAENSVSESIKSRQNLIKGLEKLLETNREALAKEESQVAQLSARKAETETKKREVEDAIMRGLSVENSPSAPGNGDHAYGQNHGDDGFAAPAVEALTPPPVEALTPPPQAQFEDQNSFPSAATCANQIIQPHRQRGTDSCARGTVYLSQSAQWLGH